MYFFLEPIHDGAESCAAAFYRIQESAAMLPGIDPSMIRVQALPMTASPEQCVFWPPPPPQRRRGGGGRLGGAESSSAAVAAQGSVEDWVDASDVGNDAGLKADAEFVNLDADAASDEGGDEGNDIECALEQIWDLDMAPGGDAVEDDGMQPSSDDDGPGHRNIRGYENTPEFPGNRPTHVVHLLR